MFCTNALYSHLNIDASCHHAQAEFMCRLLSKQYNLNADLETGMILSHDFSALTELGIGSYKEASLIQRAQIRDQKVAAIMLEAGIIFHSFFIGLDIGANTKNSAVRSLMIAMIVQQVELLLFLLICNGVAFETVCIQLLFSTS